MEVRQHGFVGELKIVVSDRLSSNWLYHLKEIDLLWLYFSFW